MKQATRIKALALGCALLTAGGLAAHLLGTPAEARADAPLAVQDCTLAAAVDTTRYFGTAPGQPWDSVMSYMRNAGIDFDYGISSTLNVRLCGAEGRPSCQPILLRIQSEKSNICLGRDTAQDGKLRMLARLRSPMRNAAGERWGFTANNDSNVVYLLLRGTTTYAMYDSAGMTQFAPPGVWNWDFCPDGMTSDVPKGEWRKFPAGTLPPPCRQPAASGVTEMMEKEEEEEEEPDPTELTASYGWMACVNGCCRFYGSPPPSPPTTNPSPSPNANPRANLPRPGPADPAGAAARGAAREPRG